MRHLRVLGRFLRDFSLILGNTIILIALCLLIGEWWARSTVRIVPEATAITVQNQYAAYHPWAGFRNTPGFRYVLGNWVPVVINSWGWRGPEPELERSKSVKRAVLLGDSVAASCWGCRDEASLGGNLKRALELRTGEEWEVIDTSVGGGFSSLSLGTLAHDAVKFRPDLVVSLNGINDILVLDDRTMLRLGGGHFKHSLYHRTQTDMGNIFDPRTGQVQQRGILDQLALKSALFQIVSKMPLFAQLRGDSRLPAGQAVPAPAPTSSGYSTAHPERLDTYVNNQLAMSYLAEGSGAKFIGFLQPYFSLKHKIMGEADQHVIKTTDPALLKWMDDVYPVLRDKLEKAARDNASYHHVDLSLLFTREQVFADMAHLKYESLERSAGYELLAGRMADEAVKVLYAGRDLPKWRETHLEGTPHQWDEQAYMTANPDVRALVADGKFPNGFEHYRTVGFLEFRHSGFPRWDEPGYLAANPEVASLIAQGAFASGYEHYVKKGKKEGRRRGLALNWIEETYLEANPDVAATVSAGKFASGEEHFMKVGAAENRRGGFSGWDEEGYLIAYGDVRNAVVSRGIRSGIKHIVKYGDVRTGTVKLGFDSGIEHFLKAGAREGRNVALGIVTPH